MTDFRDSNHVFIIRIWREGREIAGAPPLWRGMAEHVSSGEKMYFADTSQILAFIKKYLLRTVPEEGDLKDGSNREQ